MMMMVTEQEAICPSSAEQSYYGNQDKYSKII
jgi:hypothetical protein